MKTNVSFWDTSAVVPLCCQQDISRELLTLWRQARGVAVWWGTTVEIRSALSRLHGEGKLAAKGLHYALARLDVLRKEWREITPSDKVRDLAETVPGTYALRALDAFQLAAALIWCQQKPKGRLFICTDVKLSEAARRAGFPIKP